MNQQEFLNKIKEQVLQEDESASVILFGSRARGDYRDDSDWDILVLTSKDTNYKFERTIRDKIYDVELEYTQAVTTIIRRKEDWEHFKITPFYENVTREGVAI